MRLARAFACLILAACARETSERPVAPRASGAPARPAPPPLPLPETAFQGPEGDAGERFATRRIGAESGGERTRYRGARIDLDVKGADLHDVFRLIADVAKVNIVVAGDVSGTVTVKLKDVPWDQALDVIARAKGLGVERDGNVISIVPSN